MRRACLDCQESEVSVRQQAPRWWLGLEADCHPVTALQNQLPEPPRQHEPCHAENENPSLGRGFLQCEDGDSNPDGCNR
jgi:hypothetical protein